MDKEIIQMLTENHVQELSQWHSPFGPLFTTFRINAGGLLYCISYRNGTFIFGEDYESPNERLLYAGKSFTELKRRFINEIKEKTIIN